MQRILCLSKTFKWMLLKLIHKFKLIKVIMFLHAGKVKKIILCQQKCRNVLSLRSQMSIKTKQKVSIWNPNHRWYHTCNSKPTKSKCSNYKKTKKFPALSSKSNKEQLPALTKLINKTNPQYSHQTRVLTQITQLTMLAKLLTVQRTRCILFRLCRNAIGVTSWIVCLKLMIHKYLIGVSKKASKKNSVLHPN